MRMIAKPEGGGEKKNKNRPESSKRYLPVSSRSAWNFACVEKANKVKFNGLPGQLYVVLS